MRYFTNNPLERMMMEVPKPAWGELPPKPSKGHHCHKWGECGEVIVLPHQDRIKKTGE